jgi:arylsulfatase A-like enzyme
VLAFAIALAAIVAGSSERAAGDPPPPPPNVVLLFTDDQSHTDMGPMPAVRSAIGGEGATFERAYVSYPLCCPSRATMLTGLYMHNHGVRGNGGSHGGWPRFKDSLGEDTALPVRLQGAGYYSAHIGKYMNGYNAAEGLYVPPGWDEWYGRIGGETKVYYDYTLVEQGPSGVPVPVFYPTSEASYSTDVFAAKALDFIERADSLAQPFFLSVSFSAPHHPFTPAPRDLFRLDGQPPTKRPGFNERNIRDKPRWLRREARHRLGPGERTKIANEQRRRDEALLGADSAINSIVHSLEQQGLLENTYVIFTSDNGLFRGEHRIAGGKYLAYEPSSHVPLMIRGPGISPGTSVDELVSNVDLAQTVLEAAGIADPDLDGRSLLPFAQDPALVTTRPLLLEADTGPGHGIGAGNDPDVASSSRAVARAGLANRAGVTNLDQEKLAGVSQATGDRAPAYRAIRTDRYLYVLYASGDRELYDMYADPAQLRSLAKAPRWAPVRQWLFGHLVELLDCAGAACRAEIGEPPEPLPAAGG